MLVTQLRAKRVKLDLRTLSATDAEGRSMWLHWRDLTKESQADSEEQAGLQAAQGRYLATALTNYHK